MRFLVFRFVLLWLLSASLCSAQEFDRLYTKSVQPALSQPLQWVAALGSAAPTLPEAFIASPALWTFQPYTASTALPTANGNDVWASFTLAATAVPQSWIVRVPKITIEKVSLYSAGPDGTWRAQAAGMSIAPALWSLRTRAPSFEVQSRSTPQTYFMRFEHSGPISERPSLISPIDFADGASRIGTLIGVMFGMCSILIVVCIASDRLANDTVFFSLGAFVASILLTNLVIMGYGGWRIWPDSLYLNRAMRWTAPLLALAAGSWFCAQASYAKATSTVVYRLLGFAVLGSLLLAGITLTTQSDLPRDLFNGWFAFVLTSVIGSLVWLCLKGQRWNLWLLGGLVPLAAAASSRLAYNYGWLLQADTAQTASVFLTQAGLMWLFLALVWRSRASLLTNERRVALETYDAATGLRLASVVKVHLPGLLLRADRLKLNCGVMMLRWVDYNKNINTLGSTQRADTLALFGKLLQRVARDIDIAARYDESNFVVLIEGPVNRTALASLGTQVISSCLRASEKADKPNLFNLHIAIWHANDQPATADEVVELLKTRLNQMSAGTQRAVQFVDTASSVPATTSAQESTQRRQDVIDKINAIESAPRLPQIAVRRRSNSPRNTRG
jgi:two-component system, sensor histidine kinase LadS